MLQYNKSISIRGINSGYYYFIDTEHPLKVGNSGLVYLHRHVASLKIGRWLKDGEVAHHINHNKLDNSETNLEVMTESEHLKIHHPALAQKSCLTCQKLFPPDKLTSKFCSPNCYAVHSTRNKELTKELLDDLIPKYSWVALGKMFGYSDNGIKKRAKALGCAIPKRK